MNSRIKQLEGETLADEVGAIEAQNQMIAYRLSAQRGRIDTQLSEVRSQLDQVEVLRIQLNETFKMEKQLLVKQLHLLDKLVELHVLSVENATRRANHMTAFLRSRGLEHECEAFDPAADRPF